MVYEEVRKVLLGSFEHSLDAKGRVFVPAKFREELGSTIILVYGLNACIYVFSIEQWKAFSEKFSSLPMSNVEAQKVIRRLYASAIEREPDKQGRIVLSNELKEYANIQDDVKIIGMENRVEIWSKDEWVKYAGADTDKPSEAVLEVLAGFGI